MSVTGRSGEPHLLLDFRHRAACERTCVVRPGSQILLHSRWIRGDLLGAGPNRYQLSLHRLVQNFLAVDASPARRPALMRNVLDGCGRAERFVEMVDIADFRRPWIGASYALRIGDGRLQLLPDRFRIFE